MKRTLNRILVLSIMLITLFSACKKEEKATEGDVTIKLNHTWGMSGNFALNTDLVHPMNGDTMNFTKYKYYISNLILKKADGTSWVQPESYFLVDLSNAASTSITLENVPVGDYTELSYTLGVDSTRNVSGAQSGALSTTMDMFWSWTTGYIMIKAEGTSPQSNSGSFTFHIGGFKGQYSAVQTKAASFVGNELSVSGEKTSEIHFNVNTAMTWCNTGGCAANNSVMMPSAISLQMATDFHNGFVFDKIIE